MTICVAAICDSTTVLGASDRMLTAGDVEFEPEQTKIVNVTNSIAIMLAGDAPLQIEIAMKIVEDSNQKIATNPKVWLNVQDIADSYTHYYGEASRKRSQASVLAPFGLDHNSFISRQKDMSEGFIRQLATELINFETRPVETIFTGIDATGPHIYVARNAEVTCQDSVGFAAIGAGEWHARSQFMFAGHVRGRPLPETLLLTYSSKKRSEVAPGVGRGTDMFMIGPSLGSYIVVGPHVIAKLEEIYGTAQKRERKGAEKSKETINQYVQDLAKAATAKDQAAVPKDSGGETSVDQEELRNGSKEGEPET